MRSLRLYPFISLFIYALTTMAEVQTFTENALCPALCVNIQSFLDTQIAGRLALIATPPEDPVKEFELDLLACYKVGLIPWEDEDLSDGDIAFNCRDFTRWFIECMQRLKHPDVKGLSMYCRNCDSGSSKGHRIVLYKKLNGLWCPGEPQREDGGEIPACCNEDIEAAAACARNKHCTKQVDACCEGDHHRVESANYCRQEKCCYSVPDPMTNNKEHLCFDIPVIGTVGGDCPPEPKLVAPSDASACKDAIRECLRNKPDCRDCFRSRLAECTQQEPIASTDSDGDGVIDGADNCPGTTPGTIVCKGETDCKCSIKNTIFSGSACAGCRKGSY